MIDGSNLATEGRSMPSLKQLVEAVQAFMQEQPDALVTVVVDATFGHRIDPREVPEFDAAVDHNELVTPPAGAVGRGDAFVLAIANKVGATIVSNDSYQEFHGEHTWLFDDGRLIGGKPVPHVGWVFVDRVPVRGPLSRRATRDAKQKDRVRPPAKETAKDASRIAAASSVASGPMPVPAAPPPGARLPAKRGRRKAGEPSVTAGDRAAALPGSGTEPDAGASPAPAPRTEAPAPTKTVMMNDLLPFLGFVESHSVGTTIEAVVESYSSHGAYVSIGDVRAYVPLRLMADPPPRSAREVMKLGATVALVVTAFHAPRRGIDLAVPAMATTPAPPVADADAPARRRSRRSAPVDESTPTEVPVVTGRSAKRSTAASDGKPVAKPAGKSVAKPDGKPATKPDGKAPRKRATKAADAPAADVAPPAAPEPGTPETPARKRRARAASAPDPTPGTGSAPAAEPASPEPAGDAPAAPAKRARRAVTKEAAPAPKKASRTAPAKSAAAASAEAPAPTRTTRSRAARAVPEAPAVEPVPPAEDAPAASAAPTRTRSRTRAKG